MVEVLARSHVEADAHTLGVGRYRSLLFTGHGTYFWYCLTGLEILEVD